MASTNYSVLAADDEPSSSVNNVQVVVAEPADLVVIHRKRQRRGAGGCCCVAIVAFFLLFFLIPRTPSVTYKGTALNLTETNLQSEFRLDNNDYYSVEWSEADFQIAYKSTNENLCTAAGAKYSPCWIVVATANEDNEKWNTGALASKTIKLDTQFEISGITIECLNYGQNGYVLLRSSGTIKARTSTTTQKVNVKMQAYAVQCYA